MLLQPPIKHLEGVPMRFSNVYHSFPEEMNGQEGSTSWVDVTIAAGPFPSNTAMHQNSGFRRYFWDFTGVQKIKDSTNSFFFNHYLTNPVQVDFAGHWGFNSDHIPSSGIKHQVFCWTLFLLGWAFPAGHRSGISHRRPCYMGIISKRRRRQLICGCWV